MPEPDVADMEGFLSHIELVLPVLGFDFLKPRPIVRPGGGGDVSKASPVFEYTSGEASAKAQEIDGEFVVLKGSTAQAVPKESWTSYRGLRDSLIEEQKLVAIPDRPLYLFAEDITLKSPSAGAAIVNAGNINGRTAWKVSITKQTYADWHQSQFPDVLEEADG